MFPISRIHMILKLSLHTEQIDAEHTQTYVDTFSTQKTEYLCFPHKKEVISDETNDHHIRKLSVWVSSVVECIFSSIEPTCTPVSAYLQTTHDSYLGSIGRRYTKHRSSQKEGAYAFQSCILPLYGTNHCIYPTIRANINQETDISKS